MPRLPGRFSNAPFQKSLGRPTRFSNPTENETTAPVLLMMAIEIGNLVKDDVDGQDTIKGNLYNKVTDTRNKTAGNDLHFTYSASLNRVSKVFGKDIPNDRSEQSEYYVHDANGNILAVYGRNRTTRITNLDWLAEVNPKIIAQKGTCFGINFNFKCEK